MLKSEVAAAPLVKTGPPIQDIVQVSGRLVQPSEGSSLAGFNLESPPSSGWTGDIYEFPVQGWVLANDGSVQVEAAHRGRVLRRAKADFPRLDVQKRFNMAHSDRAGFSTRIVVPGLPPKFEITLRALLANGERVPFAILEGDHKPLRTSYEASLRPLMVTMMGRVGSSWFMRLLSQHPHIVIYPARVGDPYETRAASYWMHMLKVLLEPADHDHSTPRNDFTTKHGWIGHHPFNTPWVTHGLRGIDRWFGRTYVEHVAEFCQNSIEEFYLRVSSSMDKEQPLYFAEKCQADHIPWLTWELYPDAREVVLVRDFRDMVSSILAFNEKRGYHAFGREKVTSDLEYVRKMGVNALSFVNSWELRADRTLLIRYEDLVREPEGTLERLFEYLDVETNVANLLSKAREGSVELTSHRTSEDAAASIGRWKRELKPEVKEACGQAFGEALSAFGYE